MSELNMPQCTEFCVCFSWVSTSKKMLWNDILEAKEGHITRKNLMIHCTMEHEQKPVFKAGF